MDFDMEAGDGSGRGSSASFSSTGTEEEELDLLLEGHFRRSPGRTERVSGVSSSSSDNSLLEGGINQIHLQHQQWLHRQQELSTNQSPPGLEERLLNQFPDLGGQGGQGDQDNAFAADHVQTDRVPREEGSIPADQPPPSTGPTAIEFRARGPRGLPFWFHRFMLVCISLIIPLLELDYLGIYFILWQLAVWKLFCGLKSKTRAPYVLLTFMLNLGLTEEQILGSRHIIRVVARLWTDWVVFVMSNAVLHVTLGPKLFYPWPQTH